MKIININAKTALYIVKNVNHLLNVFFAIMDIYLMKLIVVNHQISNVLMEKFISSIKVLHKQVFADNVQIIVVKINVTKWIH